MDEVTTFFIFVLSLVVARLPVSVTETRDYCFPNAFNITCEPDAVIVVTSARYGRMSKGKCLTSDYHVGCWADVLYHVDRKCSGRHHCLITIPDSDLHQLQPCPKDLLAYLETEYVCQKVEGPSTASACRYYGDLTVEGRSGYMANIITEEHGYGSQRCPWVVSVPRGQRINLTLVDFGVSSRFLDVGNMCHVYAKISETRMASEVTVCGSRTRERSIYISETNRLEVAIMSLKDNEQPIYFLLKYQAIGCTDPWVPKGAWMKRAGEKAIISCNHTSQTWHIVCQGSGWYGNVDNCTTHSLTPKTSTLSSNSKDRFPYGLPVAVVTGLVVGVLLGIAMLAIVIACFKRWVTPSAPQNGRKPSQTMARNFFNATTLTSIPISPYHAHDEKSTTSHHHICMGNGSNDYDYSNVFMKGNMQALPPPSTHSPSCLAAAAAALQGATSDADLACSRQGEFAQIIPQQGNYDRPAATTAMTVEYRVDCRHALERAQSCCHDVEPVSGDTDGAYWQGPSV